MKKQLHLAATILFLAAFAAAGVRGMIRRDPYTPVIDGTGAQCCTDATLKLYFGVSNGTQLITEHLAKLPRNLPLVIVYPASNPDANLASQVVGTVVWPREVLMTPVSPATPLQYIENIREQPISGMIFCAIPPPPAFPAGEPVIPKLFLVPPGAK